MRGRARAEVVGAALLAVAVLLYAVVDHDLADAVIYVGTLVCAGVVAWVGAARAPAEHRLVARLIAGGISLTALGDGLWELLDELGRSTDVSVADPAWFASYALMCAALAVVLTRVTAGDSDAISFAIDAATIVTVSVLLFWSASVGAIVADTDLPAHVRLVWSAYPVADAVLLALVVRVLTSSRARSALDPSFAVGVCLWLAADIAYLRSTDGSSHLVMDAAWMVAPALMARSVWRLGPSPVQVPAAPTQSRGHRLAQLGVAIGPLLVPPALEMAAHLRGDPGHPLLLMVGMTLLILLAFARMARLVRSEDRAQRELEVARDAALDASRAKSMFLATMSHEIRTPLTMVLGAGEMLDETPLDEVQRDLVRRMRRSGRLLQSLVDGVLDFSRIEAGQVELAAAPFDLHALVEDLAGLYRSRADDRGIGFEAVVHPGVPRSVVGDPDRLLQVLSNLLDNAVKFTHDGLVRIEVRPVTEADGVVELAVSDTGIGIPAEHLAGVFESFRQVDGSTTRRYGGTGLGLAICKELTELMGGSLEVASEVGSGSRFVVRLPLAPAPGTADEAPAGADAPALDPARAAAFG